MARPVDNLLSRRNSGEFLRNLRQPKAVQTSPGLGDRVASALAAVGITKERAAAVLGDCGCKQRQQWLNEVGHRIGIGTPNIHETGNTPPLPTG